MNPIPHPHRPPSPSDSPGYRLDILELRQNHPRSLEVPLGSFALSFHPTSPTHIRTRHQSLHIPASHSCHSPAGSVLLWDPGSGGHAIVATLSLRFLAAELAPFKPGLRPEIRDSVFGSNQSVTSSPLTSTDRDWIDSVMRPPLLGNAHTFWHRAKIHELLALHFFPSPPPPTEFFCSRQNRLAAERVAKVKNLLALHIDEPLHLHSLAKNVGCSAHYLCRTFSAQAGMTISRYLRQLRIDRAAELLLAGNLNVSETALEVGYNSLSHFSKAFQLEKGCPPSRYSAASPPRPGARRTPASLLA